VVSEISDRGLFPVRRLDGIVNLKSPGPFELKLRGDDCNEYARCERVFGTAAARRSCAQRPRVYRSASSPSRSYRRCRARKEPNQIQRLRQGEPSIGVIERVFGLIKVLICRRPNGAHAGSFDTVERQDSRDRPTTPYHPTDHVWPIRILSSRRGIAGAVPNGKPDAPLGADLEHGAYPRCADGAAASGDPGAASGPAALGTGAALGEGPEVGAPADQRACRDDRDRADVP
jgi:hypothetical protein